MFRKTHRQYTPAEATRLGARDNLFLGIAQFGVGVLTGNLGFITEAGHQVADAASFQAKATAMRHDCAPAKAKLMRKFGAGVLIVGGFLGIAGGASHIKDGKTEGHDPTEVSAAIIGAATNIAIIRRAHGSHHDDHEHSHSQGASLDAVAHMAGDAITGVLYASSLLLESRIPGVSNAALLANGTIVGGIGFHTAHRIRLDDRTPGEAHDH